MDSDPCSVHLIGLPVRFLANISVKGEQCSLPVRWSPTFCLNNAIVSRQATWRRPLTADPPQCWRRIEVRLYWGTRRQSACLLLSRKKVWWNSIHVHFVSHQTFRYTYRSALLLLNPHTVNFHRHIKCIPLCKISSVKYQVYTIV